MASVCSKQIPALRSMTCSENENIIGPFNLSLKLVIERQNVFIFVMFSLKSGSDVSN